MIWFWITEREENILCSLFVVVAVDRAPTNQILKHPV